MTLIPVAIFHSPFSEKFGIPRQSGLVTDLRGTIEFLPEYRNPDYLRGLEDFDMLWLIWQFSANKAGTRPAPTVRPPRLGGNKRMGVFATRSPYRPNPLGLSVVKIIDIDTALPAIHVAGADLMDGTPIFDIKPYIAYADAHPGVRSGFVDNTQWHKLHVVIPHDIATLFTEQELNALRHTLELDPRPHYHNDPSKIYGMTFAGRNLHFTVDGDTLTILNAD